MTLEKKELRREVKQFLNSDSVDYVEFINSLKDVSVPWDENSVEKNQYLDENPLPEYEKKWIDEGVHGEMAGEQPIHELDFVKFSFTVMKEFVKDEEVRKLIEVIEEMPETDRRKNLRIYLFKCLQNPESPFFDIENYSEIYNQMVSEKNRAEAVIKQSGVTLHSKGFDSFLIQCSEEEAEQVMSEINSKLEIGQVSMKSFETVISLRNIADFKVGDHWERTMTGGTDYDRLKKEIINLVKDNDFNKAHQLISDSIGSQRYGNEDILRDYNAFITDAKNKINEATQ